MAGGEGREMRRRVKPGLHISFFPVSPKQVANPPLKLPTKEDFRYYDDKAPLIPIVEPKVIKGLKEKAVEHYRILYTFYNEAYLHSSTYFSHTCYPKENLLGRLEVTGAVLTWLGHPPTFQESMPERFAERWTEVGESWRVYANALVDLIPYYGNVAFLLYFVNHYTGCESLRHLIYGPLQRHGLGRLKKLKGTLKGRRKRHL